MGHGETDFARKGGRWGRWLATLLIPTAIAGWQRNARASSEPDAGTAGGDAARITASDAGARVDDAYADAGIQPATTTGQASQSPLPPPSDAVPPPAATPPPDGSPSLGPPTWAIPFLGLAPLQLHAFVSQGFMLGTENNYLAHTTRGSFDFTEAGINFTQVLTERMRMGMQLYARRLGDDGDFTAQVDWLYLDYRFADWFGLRAGRTKIPFGLYNEEQDADSARVPVLLPQAVYEILNSNLLLAQTGLEGYGYVRLGAVGGLEYRLYGGTLFSSPPPAPAGTTLTNFQVPYLLGGRALWDTPLEGLRVGASLQALRFDSDYTLAVGGGKPPLAIEENLPLLLWLGSAEYTVGNLVLAGEYGRWRGDVELTGLPTTHVVNERYYGMASYRVARWLTPGVYYSSLITDTSKPNTQDNYQRDFAATLRFDLNSFWLVKLEGHFITGTADLSTSLNNGTPLANLARDWTFFAVKTTAYF